MAELRDAEGNLVADVPLEGEPVKAPKLGSLGDVRFSVPEVIKVFLGGTEKSKVRPVKAIVGTAMFPTMVPGIGLALISAAIVATRAEDTIDGNGVKRQNVSYEVDFGSIGRFNGSEQMTLTDPLAKRDWHKSLIADFREWRKAENIQAPLLVVGSSAVTYAD